jgi:predicted negative regulator of RcsB-dependent stress response
MMFVVICVGFWIGWHLWQVRMESKNYEDDMKVLQHGDNMAKALRGKKVLRSM